MGAPDLIFELRRKGYSIVADGGYLDISPADELSVEFVQQLRQSKFEILCALHREKELKRLVRLVSDHHGFSQVDYEEALDHALSDPVNALTCFTSLAYKAELI